MKKHALWVLIYLFISITVIINCKNIFETGRECITKDIQSTEDYKNVKIEGFKYLNQDGTVNEEKQKKCDSSNTYNIRENYKQGCMAIVLVVADRAYVADINIYDAFGKNVHSSTQRFGYCGEYNNPNIMVPGGSANYLIWNLKDDYGRRVPSGVYTWEVLYSYDTGFERKVVYKSGYICSNNSFNCTLVSNEK